MNRRREARIKDWNPRGGRGGRGGGNLVISDPPDGMLPLQPWAAAERVTRKLTERGYDDPTAHCFPRKACRGRCGFPQGVDIIQTPNYVVFLMERTSWRIVPLDGRPHLPDNMRLWEGDSVGHWEGDTLVIDTTNFNGKTWLNEGGDIVSYAEHVVERFTPSAPDTVSYEATVTDPVVYSPHGSRGPWRSRCGGRNSSCWRPPRHEEDMDLPSPQDAEGRGGGEEEVATLRRPSADARGSAVGRVGYNRRSVTPRGNFV